MDAFALANLIAAHDRAGRAYLEFLRRASLSVGLYRLPAGGIDPQQPHTEDEVYYLHSWSSSRRPNTLRLEHAFTTR